MKLAALILAAAVSSPPSSSPQGEPPTIVMSVEQVALCEAEGGCGVVSRAYILELQRRAFKEGAKQDCRIRREI